MWDLGSGGVLKVLARGFIRCIKGFLGLRVEPVWLRVRHLGLRVWG